MKLDVKEFEGKMQKTLTAYEKELESIRLGRANPVVLNKITVDYYGCPTQISQMAEVKTTDARTLMITPWDATTLRSMSQGRAVYVMEPDGFQDVPKNIQEEIIKNRSAK